MTFEVEVAGRLRRVAVEPIGPADASGGRFRVVVDDEALEVDARPTELGLSIVTSDRTVLDAALTGLARGEWTVEFPHVVIPVAVDARRFRRAGGSDAAAGTGQQRVVAPMPGRVVRVLVRAGDEVQARQGLVVIEAMKMENELRASRAGRVTEVAAAEGTSVESGRLLVVVE